MRERAGRREGWSRRMRKGGNGQERSRERSKSCERGRIAGERETKTRKERERERRRRENARENVCRCRLRPSRRNKLFIATCSTLTPLRNGAWRSARRCCRPCRHPAGSTFAHRGIRARVSFSLHFCAVRRIAYALRAHARIARRTDHTPPCGGLLFFIA